MLLDGNWVVMVSQLSRTNAQAVPPFWALAGQMYKPAPYMLEVIWAPLVGATVKPAARSPALSRSRFACSETASPW